MDLPGDAMRQGYECVPCGQMFGSVDAFDHHRVGDFISTGPAEYVDRLRADLCPADEWKPEYGRRCLEIEEMEADRLLARNSYGQWSIAKDILAAEKIRRARGRGGRRELAPR
jgi:hypothetical protein